MDAEKQKMDLNTDGAIGSANAEWRRILKDIDEQLDSSEVTAMCFLCRDHIPGARLEKVSRGLDLFDELENKSLMSSLNGRYLCELVFRTERHDLLRRLNHTVHTFRAEILKSGSCFTPFR